MFQEHHRCPITVNLPTPPKALHIPHPGEKGVEPQLNKAECIEKKTEHQGKEQKEE